jgi:uncharacterized protein YutD
MTISKDTFQKAIANGWYRIRFHQDRTLCHFELNEFFDAEAQRRADLWDAVNYVVTDTSKDPLRLSGLAISEVSNTAGLNLSVAAGKVVYAGRVLPVPAATLVYAANTSPRNVWLVINKVLIQGGASDATHDPDLLDPDNSQPISERESWVVALSATSSYTQPAGCISQVIVQLATCTGTGTTFVATYNMGLGINNDDLQTLRSHVNKLYTHGIKPWDGFTRWNFDSDNPAGFFSGTSWPNPQGKCWGVDGNLHFFQVVPSNLGYTNSFAFCNQVVLASTAASSGKWSLVIPVLAVDDYATAFIAPLSAFPANHPSGQHPYYLASSSWTQATVYANSASKVIGGSPFIFANKNFVFYDLDRDTEYVVCLILRDTGNVNISLQVGPWIYGNNTRVADGSTSTPAGTSGSGTSGCIRYDQLVTLKDSPTGESYSAPMSAVDVGKYILGIAGFQQILWKGVFRHTEYRQIALPNAVLRCTGEHPIAVDRIGEDLVYTLASNLKVGDSVLTLDGFQPVVHIADLGCPESDFYDIHVKNTPCYYVNGVLVHNLKSQQLNAAMQDGGY